ncbi:MAG: pilus assembly protein TadG-related protein [Anaerolineae bacterium]|jgi:hypothetical protein
MSEKDLEKMRGQSIILVAAALVALVLLVAITVDMSDAYYHRRTAQNAADGAALAGAGELARQINAEARNDQNIEIQMNDFAQRNDIVDSNPADPADNKNVLGYYLDVDHNRIMTVGAGTVPDPVWGIEAITYITAPTYFGGIFGLSGLPLEADATVYFGAACGAGCVVPIATHTDTIALVAPSDGVTPCVNIWNGEGPGNFGWLNWSWQIANPKAGAATPPEECKTDDCSSNCLGENLDPFADCSSGWIAVGDWAAGTTGVSNDVKIRRHLQEYIGIEEKPNDDGVFDPIEFVVVVYGPGENTTDGWIGYNGVITDGTGCGKATDPETMHGQFYNVVGFAKMQLLGYKLSQGDAYDPVLPPWPSFSYTECITMGVVPPNNGNRLTAVFREWVDGAGGSCSSVSTVNALTLDD